ncbi:MAG: transcription termination/antitermination protein NusG [Clostridiaceae bacterium]|nr:transcription termination/antitermination protein NusG [Clostridiaceae bacterium]
MATEDAKWYVVHTYSGYENKVKANIEKIVENRGLQDQILEVQVPVEEVIETKDNKKRVVLKKIFPGYVIIKMVMTDESWYLVRNTRGVTGFVGPGSKPVPISEEEVKAMGIDVGLPRVNFQVGDSVKVVSGPLENFIGVIEEINPEKKKAKVIISMFGRDTPVELDFNQIEGLI